MNKVFLNVLLTLMFGLFFLTGCKGNEVSTDQTPPQTKTMEQKLNSSSEDQITPETQNDDIENQGTTTSAANKYVSAGIEDAQAFEAFFNQFKSLVLANDKTQLSALFTYPMSINFDGTAVTYPDKNSFVLEYDTIFTPVVKTALQNQKIEDLFVNYQGVMVGNGEVWLGMEGNHYVIISINSKP